MDNALISIITALLLTLLYFFIFIFKLREILNFCTRKNWHPTINLLAFNIFIFCASFPIYLLDPKDHMRFCFTTIIGGFLAYFYFTQLFDKKLGIQSSIIENKNKDSLSGIYAYLEAVNRKFFNKDHLSFKDVLLVFIYTFPYPYLFTQKPIYITSFHVGYFATIIIVAFLSVQASKIASPEDYK